MNDDASYRITRARLLREPDLVNHWKSGDTRQSACISENACFVPARKGQGIRCVHETT